MSGGPLSQTPSALRFTPPPEWLLKLVNIFQLKVESSPKWDITTLETLKEFIWVQSERYMKYGLFADALNWLEIGKVIFVGDETSVQEFTPSIFQCYLEMGKFDKATEEIFNTSNIIHGYVFRIQLSIKLGKLPGAIALIGQMTDISGIKTTHFLPLPETNSNLIKVYVLEALLSVERGNVHFIRTLLALIARTNELIPRQRIGIVY